jgi:hypothetical protein
LTNPFRYFWDRGYRRLLPVIPTAAGIRMAGKRPGTYTGSYWQGAGAKTFNATEADLDTWHAMGASVGLRCDQATIGIDIDVLNAEWSAKVAQIAREEIGEGAVRIGRAPKTMLVFQTYDTMAYRQWRFDDGTEKGGLVELLAGEVKWFVVQGVHHTTKMKYDWPAGVPQHSTLAFADAAKVGRFFERIEKELPPRKNASTGAAIDRNATDQESLKAPADKMQVLADIIKQLPNRYDEIGGYEKWVRIAAACRGAFQEDPELGCDAFVGFSENTDLTESEEDPERIYKSLNEPFGLGYQYLLTLIGGLTADGPAREHVNTAPLHFEELPDEPEHTETPEDELFPVTGAAPAPEAIKWVRPSEWAGITPPEREWEVPGWIPKGEVTLLYGDGGIGKTLLIHMYATAAAAGIPWLGQPTRKTKVMCFFCEDSEDELLRRQIDINRALGVTFEDIDENLRIASRKYMDNLLILWDRNTGALKRQSIWEQIRDDAVAFGAGVFIGDTIADMFGGNEIDRSQVNAFVKSCLGRLGQEMGGSVIALGHPSMSGKASGSGTSGSTAWNNAVRSRLYLRYPKGVEKGNVRELEGMKLNYGPKGNVIKLRWNRGAFDVVASSMAPVGGDAPKAFEGSVPTLEQASDQVVLDAIVTCSGEPVALNMKPNSPHYAPKVLKRREPDLLVELGDEEVAEALGRLEARGVIRAGEVGRDAYRRPVAGYTVVRVEADTVSESVFD